MSHKIDTKNAPWTIKLDKEQDARFKNFIGNVNITKTKFLFWAMETLYSHLTFKFKDDYKAMRYFMAGFIGEISYRYESPEVQKEMLDIKSKLTERR